MILNKEEKEINYESNSTFEGHDASISEEDLHKLWSMLQDPYKNNVGSLIREYSSNCFDSHSEANVTDAVHVKMGKDDTGHYWCCEDFGVGLSPERIVNVFMKYLKSTKENTNNQIGMFGLGSKSGLSYTDIVHIRTRFDNIEYTYILRKGEKTPRLEKLFEEPTTERNGTLIKIYIKEVKNKWGYKEFETTRFEDECRKQLCYFDNIYFDNCGVNNDYKIIEGKHWKYNTHVQPFSTLHLVLGKVAYPIDWDNLQVDQIDLRVALKFDIGELDIIQTREDVKYTPRTKEAIINKIQLLKEEFKDCWNKQDFELDDIYKYDDKIYKKEYSLNFGGYLFYLNQLFNDVELESLNYYTYKPLENWEGKIPSNFFFGYKTNRRLGAQGRVLKIQNYQHKITELLEPDTRNVGYKIQGETNTKTNKYIYSLSKYIYFIEKNYDVKLSEYVKFLKLTHLDKREKLLAIKKYQEVMEIELCKVTKSYKDVIIDPAWELAQKENNQRNKIPKEIVVTKRFEYTKEFERYECNLNKIGNICIIIGTKEQENDLKFWHYKYLKKIKSNALLYSLVVAKNNIKKFKELKNVWTIDQIMSEESKVFKKVVTAYKIFKEDQFILKLDPQDYIDIYKPISDDIATIKNLISEWSEDNVSSNKFIEKNCVPIAEEHNLYDKDILDTVQRIKDYFEGLEILQFVNPTITFTGEHDENGNKIHKREFPVRETAKYIYNTNKVTKNKLKFKRLNPYYYCNFNQEQLGWKKPIKTTQTA